MNDEITQVEPEKKRGGEWVTFGLEQYRIPPLSFSALKELAPRFAVAQAEEQGTDSRFDAVMDIVTTALKRNYPRITREDVGDLVDVGNYMDVFMTIARIAGMVKPGDPSAGEALASTGTSSTSA